MSVKDVLVPFIAHDLEMACARRGGNSSEEFWMRFAVDTCIRIYALEQLAA